jgi:prepilin signal peptidase PulO-like enzyme (type II secretory pathway)
MIQHRDSELRRPIITAEHISLTALLQIAMILIQRLWRFMQNHSIESVATFVSATALLIGFDTMGAAIAFSWWLLVIVVVRSDLTHFLIPDWASLGIAALGLAYAAIKVATIDGSSQEMLLAVAFAMLQGLCAAALLWMVERVFYFFTDREGLGFGDVKLAGASAVWLTPLEQTVALQLAILAAIALVLLSRRADARGTVIPFGAFLAPATWLVHVINTVSSDLLGGVL